MTDDILRDCAKRMEQSVVVLERSFAKIRTGRATPELLDGVEVDYYGNPTPISQVASITVEGGRSLIIKPWENALIEPICTAIEKADLGFRPSSNSGMARIDLPSLSEDTRKDMVRRARKEAESSRVAVRNVRRDCTQHIDKSELSEDEMRVPKAEIQKLTDKWVGEIDSKLREKEKALTEF